MKKNTRIKRLLSDATGRKAWRLYLSKIRPLARRHSGEFAALDVSSGEYALAGTAMEALDRLKETHPKAKVYFFRIGGLDRLRTFFAR